MPTANWKRLGEMLVRRRIELDPRYANRHLFSEERGISYRILSDIERGRRDNYEPATLTAAEVAYAVTPGSLARALEGGELEPVAAAVSPAPLAAVAPAGDPAGDPQDDTAARLFPGDTRHDRILRNIWRLGQYGTTREERIGMIEVVDPALAAALRDVGGQSEVGLALALQLHVQCNDSDT